jgi:anti-sigma B factor antagonist
MSATTEPSFGHETTATNSDGAYVTVDFTTQIKELSDRAAVLELAGEIDLVTAPMLEAQFESLVELGVTDVVVDATGVTFMDSSGIRALLQGEKIIHSNGSGVYLVPSHHVRRLFELVSAEPLLSGGQFGTVEEAVAALRTK